MQLLKWKKIIPEYYKKQHKDDNIDINDLPTLEELKVMLHLKNLNVTTIWKWMKNFGCEFS